MNSFFENPLKMFRLFYVLSVIGTPVLYVTSIVRTVYNYVCGETPGSRECSVESKPSEMEEGLCENFCASVDNLFHLFPEISSFTEASNNFFKQFHDFSLEIGVPVATVLVSKKKKCRKCESPCK